MKSEKFISSEIEIIVLALTLKVQNNELDFDLNNGSIMRNNLKSEFNNDLIKSLILKFQQEPILKFTKKETLKIISAINQSLSKLEKDNEIDFNNPLFFLNISTQQKGKLDLIDLHKDILEKSGFYKTEKFIPIGNQKFRYRHIFDIIEKLQKSDTVFLSKSDKFYKIGFFYNRKELATFNLSQRINILENPFSIEKETVSQIANRFGIQTDKLNAKKVFSNIKTSVYSEYVIEFFLKILET